MTPSSESDQTVSEKTREFSVLNVASAKWKTRSLKTSEFDQSNTSEFDQNVSQKISEVFISEFSGLGIVENVKFGGEKDILRDFREL